MQATNLAGALLPFQSRSIRTAAEATPATWKAAALDPLQSERARATAQRKPPAYLRRELSGSGQGRVSIEVPQMLGVGNFVGGASCRHPMTVRSSKIMADWAFASPDSRGGRPHSSSAAPNKRQSGFIAVFSASMAPWCRSSWCRCCSAYERVAASSYRCRHPISTFSAASVIAEIRSR